MQRLQTLMTRARTTAPPLVADIPRRTDWHHDGLARTQLTMKLPKEHPQVPARFSVHRRLEA